MSMHTNQVPALFVSVGVATKPLQLAWLSRLALKTHSETIFRVDYLH
jgi:hypothetical protein